MNWRCLAIMSLAVHIIWAIHVTSNLFRCNFERLLTLIYVTYWSQMSMSMLMPNHYMWWHYRICTSIQEPRYIINNNEIITICMITYEFLEIASRLTTRRHTDFYAYRPIFYSFRLVYVWPKAFGLNFFGVVFVIHWFNWNNPITNCTTKSHLSI